MFVGEREVCMHACVCFQPLWVKKIEGAIIRKAVCLRHAWGGWRVNVCHHQDHKNAKWAEGH